MKPKLLVITPVKHINGVAKKLECASEVTYIDDPSLNDVLSIVDNYDAIYTNPNKSRIFIGKEIFTVGRKLSVICTASTGTNHIDKVCAEKMGVKILSLTEERSVINRISSTAEHAFSLTMSSLRNIIKGHNDVMAGRWDYEKFIGRQMDGLVIGVVGYGRLGGFYTKYCLAFGAKVMIYDPYKNISDVDAEQVNDISILLEKADVISFHVHVSDETTNMINSNWFSKMKSDVLLVNTSRGEIINEDHLVTFLKKNQSAKMATDVIYDEIRNRKENVLLKYASNSDQVIVTPHIGGMTKEAQEIAYNHAANMLSEYFNKDGC
jgi:phosphoglycerate dehydrogenase-like enzyme